MNYKKRLTKSNIPTECYISPQNLPIMKEEEQRKMDKQTLRMDMKRNTPDYQIALKHFIVIYGIGGLHPK